MATRRKKARRTTPSGSKWYLNMKEKSANLETQNDNLRKLVADLRIQIKELEHEQDSEQIILLSLKGGVIKLERFFERGPPDDDDAS